MATSGMTVLTPQLVYSFRNWNLLPLPRSVQDTIATLQLAPVQQGFVKKPKYQKSPRRRSHGSAGSGPAAADLSKNWRLAAVVEVRKRMKEVEDADYAEVFGMLNKLAKQNYEKLSGQIFEILKKREEVEKSVRENEEKSRENLLMIGIVTGKRNLTGLKNQKN